MPGKPQTFYRTMLFNDALKEYPLYSKDLQAELDFASMNYNDDKEAYCLHCGEKIRLDNIKVEILLFKKSGLPVPDDDERYCYKPKILLSCPVDGCDGSPLDWKGSPWH